MGHESLVQVGDGVPGHRLRWSFAEHVVPGRPHLGRAAADGHPAGRGGEPGAEDPVDRRAPGGVVGQNRAERGPEGEVGVGGVRYWLGNPHRWRADAPGDLGAAGLDDDGAADREFAAVLGRVQKMSPWLTLTPGTSANASFQAAVKDALRSRR